jgi:hypothetical protein
MSRIKINEIQPAGIELFTDSENLMQDLTYDPMGEIVGGSILVDPNARGTYRNFPISPFERVPETVVLPIPYSPVIL